MNFTTPPTSRRTTSLRRPRPCGQANIMNTVSSNDERRRIRRRTASSWLFLLSMALSSSSIEAFSLRRSSSSTSQTGTSLSLSTLAPPAHHLAWLQSQDEEDKHAAAAHHQFLHFKWPEQFSFHKAHTNGGTAAPIQRQTSPSASTSSSQQRTRYYPSVSTISFAPSVSSSRLTSTRTSPVTLYATNPLYVNNTMMFTSSSSPSVATRIRSSSSATLTACSDVLSSSSCTSSSVLEEQVAKQEQENENEYKDAWAAQYTTVEALRKTFGTNRNGFWGDLDPQTTRRLYKTLLPRALLQLYHVQKQRKNGSDDSEQLLPFKSEDLAPLAYRARVAAKLYARERCFWTYRYGAMLFDGIRQFYKYGNFQASGMSYPQIWEKYANKILSEEQKEHRTNNAFCSEEDLTAKICYKILEKSCETNSAVDAFILKDSEQQDLQRISTKLEQDVYELLKQQQQQDSNDKQLLPYQNKNSLQDTLAFTIALFQAAAFSSASSNVGTTTTTTNKLVDTWAIQRYKTLKTLLRIKRRLEGPGESSNSSRIISTTMMMNDNKDHQEALSAVLKDILFEQQLHQLQQQQQPQHQLLVSSKRP